MRKLVSLAAFAIVLSVSIPAMAAKTPASKSAPATIVLIFKDGRRQTFNLAEIARVEFSGASEAGGETTSASIALPSRGRYLGKWEVGDGQGSNFFITLHEDGNAMRSLGDVHGKWVYIDGEARVTWDDGAQDAIRKVGSRFQKFAYAAGKAFTDNPDNVTNARNSCPHPI